MDFDQVAVNGVNSNAKEVYKNIRGRHIDLQKRICYNCHRRKEIASPWRQKE